MPTEHFRPTMQKNEFTSSVILCFIDSHALSAQRCANISLRSACGGSGGLPRARRHVRTHGQGACTTICITRILRPHGLRTPTACGRGVWCKREHHNEPRPECGAWTSPEKKTRWDADSNLKCAVPTNRHAVFSRARHIEKYNFATARVLEPYPWQVAVMHVENVRLHCDPKQSKTGKNATSPVVCAT